MIAIPLHGRIAAGRVALVDDADAELVSQYRWHVLETVRAGRVNGPYARTKAGAGSVMMHNLITGWPGVDHADHNGLNNQRSNLRPATVVQNKANQRPRSDSVSSIYKGVFRIRKGTHRRWGARIRPGGRQVTLGYFDTEEEAARAYDTAALAAWGEYAYLNFPVVP